MKDYEDNLLRWCESEIINMTLLLTNCPSEF